MLRTFQMPLVKQVTYKLVKDRLHVDGHVRGSFGKFLAWSFISGTDLQTLSCLVSFSRATFLLCYGTIP